VGVTFPRAFAVDAVDKVGVGFAGGMVKPVSIVIRIAGTTRAINIEYNA
jgi:hypothetical protein